MVLPKPVPGHVKFNVTTTDPIRSITAKIGDSSTTDITITPTDVIESTSSVTVTFGETASIPATTGTAAVYFPMIVTATA